MPSLIGLWTAHPDLVLVIHQPGLFELIFTVTSLSVIVLWNMWLGFLSDLGLITLAFHGGRILLLMYSSWVLIFGHMGVQFLWCFPFSQMLGICLAQFPPYSPAPASWEVLLIPFFNAFWPTCYVPYLFMEVLFFCYRYGTYRFAIMSNDPPHLSFVSPVVTAIGVFYDLFVYRSPSSS